MTNQTEKEQVEQDVSQVTELAQEAQEAQTQNVEPELQQNDEIDPLEEAIARVQELEAYIAEADKREQDIQLRARAEVENIRRRAEQDVEKAHKFALEKFSKEMLTVVDNLERGLQALEGVDERVKSGIELTHKGLVSTLNNFGIEAVGVVGEVFNPELHQAISMQPAEGIEANHISVVLQKGYTLHGRVIRPAMVMVAS
ncbi:nucleotide exchange factor GrpE [Glaesserella parasuis]|uniref:nucleotide exchange factor GrpE n=1 Tax=Glaesserella parasuis TaxID=738 RepID=UPI00094FD93C|nr:nucleotide exchange factor GrpE [Glaesserella parasuis]MCT8737779.1 nucleotide exchange factor GrpE [Glaesserella parasuis]MDG4923728.1 nucleotide exchange factor GrpE [Glaesserella parasuis]MDG6227759.1 nucleotide exchange factor GrpE [Glaesserella parasuis]MDG6233637.1 nucleotide exchange factor GrpE [Glaesserella parasuis]MDG6242099.1 nucleotide exchange factor GrpE [Glaesserella parasuis]